MTPSTRSSAPATYCKFIANLHGSISVIRLARTPLSGTLAGLSQIDQNAKKKSTRNDRHEKMVTRGCKMDFDLVCTNFARGFVASALVRLTRYGAIS